MRNFPNYFDVSFKKAGKRPAVVWRLYDYCKKANRQLKDKLIYEVVDNDPPDQLYKLINEVPKSLRVDTKITE